MTVAEAKQIFQQEVSEYGQAWLSKKETERAAALASVKPFTPDWLPSKRYQQYVPLDVENKVRHSVHPERIVEHDGHKFFIEYLTEKGVALVDSIRVIDPHA